MIQFQWAGEDFAALADKALWWPRRRTLCIADVHLGKAAAFRRSGIPVPPGTTRSSLERLSYTLDWLSPARLVILGDLFHARDGRVPELDGAIGDWRSRHSDLDILLIRGNHDHRAGDPPRAWRIRVEDEPFADEGDGEILFAHHPEVAETCRGKLLCGHIHPAIVLSGALTGLRAPCFWFASRIATLPAFGAFTGTGVVTPAPGDQVFAIGDDEIVDVSPRPAVPLQSVANGQSRT